MKLQFAVILLVIGAAAATPKFDKNTPWFIRNPPKGRIVGGEEATPNEFPWIVDMRQGSHYCGGSIYNEEWVITAAHCSMSSPSAYTLTAGDHNIDIEGDSPNEQKRQVVAIIRHPGYGSGVQYENDIALMKVAPPFVFNEHVQPVKLAPPGFPETVRAIVAGWGALSQGGSSPSKLMKVDVPVVSDASCRASYGQSAIADSMICSGEEGKDSCQGDSGGPMTCASAEDPHVLCGIVSWGRGCAQRGYPGVYTEVSYFNEWIHNATVPPPEDNSTYVVQTEGCGGVLVGTSGKLSYKLNQNYNNNERCVWTIRTTTRSSIRLNLLQSGLANDDTISITELYSGDGSTAQTRRLGDEELIAGGSVIFVTFNSNGVNAGQGFSIEFYGTGFPESDDTVYRHVHLNQTTGSFDHPNYGNDEYLTIVVNPEGATRTTLKVDRLDLEDASGCQYDSLNLLNYNGATYNHVGKYCTPPLPAPLVSDNGVVGLIFMSDSSINRSGFTVSWAS